MRIVFHVDMDAFFAAVEERENPSLKGKPVVVGADPKGGKGRGVVSTCNYEARKFGVRSGMPISKAYRLCKDAVYLPVNFELYWKASDSVMSILRKYAQKLQQGGIDEAFLEPKVSAYRQAEQIAKKIKDEIRKRELLTCSIGIAPNKLVAKIASDHNKPDGLTTVKPDEVMDFLAPLSVRKLYGVGPKTEYALNQMGIKTIKDLRKQSKEKLAEIFGKAGMVMHQYARGEDDSPLEERYERRSVGQEVTFEEDTEDFSMLEKLVGEMAQNLTSAARAEGFEFTTVVLKIRFRGFETHTKQKKVKEKTQEEINRTAHDLLSAYLNSGKKIRLVGLRLTRGGK